jgi:hypothetical protein
MPLSFVNHLLLTVNKCWLTRNFLLRKTEKKEPRITQIETDYHGLGTKKSYYPCPSDKISAIRCFIHIH